MAVNTYSNKWAGAGLLSAIAASLCCITPVLAFMAGTSGLAATFSWVEPFRPYLIGITVLIIGLAWYQKLKPETQEEMDCGCEEDSKTPFLQSKTFLGIITVFAGLMLAFPYYSNAFYPQAEPSETDMVITQEKPIQKLVLEIEGMTCSGCEAHVEHAANEVDGIQKSKASYAEGKAEIEFDPAQTTPEKIIEAVKTTGYKITNSKVSSIEREQ
ncbi:MAG: mercuric transport protein MerTP [Bacteroidia bacterium]